MPPISSSIRRRLPTGWCAMPRSSAGKTSWQEPTAASDRGSATRKSPGQSSKPWPRAPASRPRSCGGNKQPLRKPFALLRAPSKISRGRASVSSRTSITSFQHGVLESIYESFVKVAVKFLLSTPKMLLSKPTPVIRNSYPLLSDSSIRRLERQNIIPHRCRNQATGLDGPMDSARLALRGQHRFPIGLSFLQHPKTGFRKMTGHRHLGAVVAASGFNPLVKLADVLVVTALAIEDCAVGGFHKRPLQINIDIAAYRPVMKLSATGVLARHQATVACQLLGTVKPFNAADLGPHDHCQDLAHSRQALEPDGLRARSKNLDHIGFNGFKILDYLVELIENVIESLFSVRRKLARQFFDDLAAPFTKSIADFVHAIAVLTQSRMHAVLQLGSLPAKDHPSARQLTGISNPTRSDLYRRQGPCALQQVQALGVEFIALVDVANHQFRQTCVDQLRLSSPGFNLIDHPVPITHGLYGHRRTRTPSLNEVLDAPAAMHQPTRVQRLALWVLDSCPGVMLVNIQCNVFHNVSPPRCVLPSTAVTVCIAFIVIRLTWKSLEHPANLMDAGNLCRHDEIFI